MRNDILQQAQAIRNAMGKVTATLTDAQAIEVKELYPLWATDTAYTADTVVRYNDKLYRCLQSHTAQSDWTPDATPALWVEIAPKGEYREIKDGMLSTEAFTLGEIGWYKEKDNLFKSLIPANTYTPETYPSGWEQVTG